MVLSDCAREGNGRSVRPTAVRSGHAQIPDPEFISRDYLVRLGAYAPFGSRSFPGNAPCPPVRVHHFPKGRDWG